MLELIVTFPEKWDEVNEIFIPGETRLLLLEHSLLAISKWESKYHKAFMRKEPKTNEELFFYIKCMCVSKNVDDDIINNLSKENIEEIENYISDPMTATTFFSFDQETPSREIITSELIYYWMVALNIPFECQKWHINKLLTLIRVCNIKNRPPKKHSKAELLRRHAAINAARRKKTSKH